MVYKVLTNIYTKISLQIFEILRIQYDTAPFEVRSFWVVLFQTFYNALFYNTAIYEFIFIFDKRITMCITVTKDEMRGACFAGVRTHVSASAALYARLPSSFDALLL